MKINAEGIANISSSGETLDIYFPSIIFGEKAILNEVPEIDDASKKLIKVNWNEHDLNRCIESIDDAYLKLHLISYKFVPPNTVNLDGLFDVLPNVAWTNRGPISLNEVEKEMHNAKINHNDLYIKSLDKFPCLTDYILPKKVRIADTRRVRLGAYLSEGTTVMHEGFVNFNSGTLGKAMIEGRISAGVVVGKNSDLGGGSSTMGTLSGGNNAVISIGENCLLGANSGIGISLGDNCIVEAGLYITAGTKIHFFEKDKGAPKILKAFEISGTSNLLFIRDSLSGRVVAKQNTKLSTLNKELHKND